MTLNQFNRSFLLKKIELQSICQITLLSLACLSYQQTITHAQITPSNPLPEPQEREVPQPLTPLPEVIPVPQTKPPQPVQLSPEEIPGTIIVKKFEIVGNTVLDPQEIEDLVQQYTLRPISFVELLQVPRKITQLYIDAGYITTAAVISPQTIEDRTVKIQIMSGKVADIKIIGLKKLKPDYIRNRLAIASEAPFNQNKLLQALQLLQVDPLIANISAELSAGIEPNTSLLEVEVAENPDTFAVELNLDNYRVASVGTLRREIKFIENNLLGYGDRFLVSYLNSDGTNALNDLDYQFPLNANNDVIKLNYSYADSDLIQEPFKILNIENQISRYEITYLQPLEQSLNRKTSAGISLEHLSSQSTFLDGLPFPDPSGASDNQGKTKVTVIRLLQEFSTRNTQQVWYVRSQISFGINALDSTINDDHQDSKFLAWSGQTQYYRLLSPDTALLIRSNLQFANDGLVPLEQFTLGGVYSVRGYAQNAVIGDNGFFISAEIHQNLLHLKKSNITLDFIPFVEFGKAWNTKRSLEQTTNTLSSLGLGLKLTVDENLVVRIDWGIPLTEIENVGDSLQENGVYFSLQTNPF